jgi:hypothetical protein
MNDVPMNGYWWIAVAVMVGMIIFRIWVSYKRWNDPNPPDYYYW